MTNALTRSCPAMSAEMLAEMLSESIRHRVWSAITDVHAAVPNLPNLHLATGKYDLQSDELPPRKV